MTKDEALKLALEALEMVKANADDWQERTGKEIKGWMQPVNNSITAIKAVLSAYKALMSQSDGAQPEQGPKHVATVAEVHMSRYTIEWTNGPLSEGTKLYITPYVATPLPPQCLHCLQRSKDEL